MPLHDAIGRFDDAHVVRMLTLWFAVATFLEVASDGGSAVETAVGVVALLLLWAIPIHLLVALLLTVDGATGETTTE
ncbi:hypothetical protein [Halobaculum litoreum]|uniref:Uncharacterized protein n=1 Tax=Halobaculum litoreum TaxID=3031998 RepID=A0ABD5XPU3_9EURY|nr:hypothetical protein [Halobaculum sp. DT92]